jgi:2-hydroxychromene-2-carboxylate isomerase
MMARSAANISSFHGKWSMELLEVPNVDLDVWIDPICPWSWLTSRWIMEIAPLRDIRIRWRPLSLLMKTRLPESSPHYAQASHSLGLLRVLEMVRVREGDDAAGRLYTEYGTHIHEEQHRSVDTEAALERAGINVGYARAASEERIDSSLRAHMAEGQALAGMDASLPFLAFRTKDDIRVGFSGPILNRRLSLEDSLNLWDGFMLTANIDGFWEIRRSRTEPINMSKLVSAESFAL